MYFAEARIDDSKRTTPGEKNRQKPIGGESVYSLVRYEFVSSRRKSRQRPDLCIFHPFPRNGSETEKR